jgi:hypothetical protein
VVLVVLGGMLLLRVVLLLAVVLPVVRLPLVVLVVLAQSLAKLEVGVVMPRRSSARVDYPAKLLPILLGLMPELGVVVLWGEMVVMLP